MDKDIIINGALSLVTFIASFVAIKIGMRQIRSDEEKKATSLALTEDHVCKIQESLNHAHDKIRELYSKNNDVNVVIAELQVTLQENTRVLRQVEQALTLLAKIEERINGHIQAEK